MPLEDLLTGLMFANRRRQDPDRVLGEALMRRRFHVNGLSGGAAQDNDMRMAQRGADRFPNREVEDATMPPAAALREGTLPDQFRPQLIPNATGTERAIPIPTEPQDVAPILLKDQGRVPQGSPPPLGLGGGMFGGMPGWDPGERPAGWPEPPQPDPRLAYTDETDEQPKDLPPVVVNPPGRTVPLRRGPAGPAAGPSGPPSAGPGLPAGGPGGLMAALGITPEAAQRIARSLGAGFASIKSSPFAGESFGQGFGGAMAGAAKVDTERAAAREKAQDRALKARGQEDLADYRRRHLDIQQQNAESLADYRREGLDVRREGTDVRREGNEIRRQNNESLDNYRRRVIDNQLEGLGIRRGELDIKRRAGESAADYNKRKLEAEERYRNRRLDIDQQNADTRRRAGESNEDYRKRQLDIQQRDSDTRRMDAETRRDRPSAWNKPDRQIELDYERAVDAKQKALERQHGIAAPGLTPSERKERAAAAKAELDAYKKDLRRRLQLDKPGPAGTSVAPPADPTGKPVTAEEYQALEPGARYQHPDDPPGTFRIKGRSRTAPAPIAPDVEDEDEEGA
jgi:hypothetical protein